MSPSHAPLPTFDSGDISRSPRDPLRPIDVLPSTLQLAVGQHLSIFLCADAVTALGPDDHCLFAGVEPHRKERRPAAVRGTSKMLTTGSLGDDKILTIWQELDIHGSDLSVWPLADTSADAGEEYPLARQTRSVR